MNNKIHPSTIISTGAVLGEGNEIGAHVIIEDDVVIGNNNKLMPGVVLKSGTRLGNGNTLHDYAVIGGNPQDMGFDIAKKTFVEIGDANVIRESVTINRATKEHSATKLGNGNYLMTQVHLGHDCQLGDNVIIAPSTGLGGHVNVENRAFISGGVMVHQFVRIGTLAMLGGNAKITQDVLPYMTIDGNSAHITGLNKVGLRRAGFKPDDIKQIKTAYQILFNNTLSLEQRLQCLEELGNQYAEHLASFVKTSRRGFHRNRA